MSHFDKAAKEYDRVFSNSLIGRAQRDRVWTYLSEILGEDKDWLILELNCGTGEDALHFAKMGHQVLATDVSSKMLDIVQQKAIANKYGRQIVTQYLDMSKPSLPVGASHSANQNNSQSTIYKMIFSDFGGVNCINRTELHHLASFLEGHIAPNGHVMLVVMPRYCIIDMLYRFVKLDWKTIYKRLFSPYVSVNVDGQAVKTYYHNPAVIKSAFSNYRIHEIRIIGLWPSFLEAWIKKLPILLRFEKVVIKALSFIGLGAKVGDHYLIHLVPNKETE